MPDEQEANRTVDTRIEHQSFDEHVKQQQYQRLRFLLDRTTIYSKFLADKLKKPEDDVSQRKARKRVTEEKGSFKQPSIVEGGKLREYQLEGVEWLVSLFENGLNGILADEMGLGKTVQCISFLGFLREQGIWGPFLVVAPLSTIENWVSEIKRFTPSVPVILYHGSQAEREVLRNEHLAVYGPKFPIVVTSYEIAMNDRKFLQKHSWKYMIVDEGHRLKNFNCKLIRELKSISSANRLLLTGTPLQNNLSELWSLLNFLLPDIFDDLDSFQSWFDLGDLQEDKFLDEQAEYSVIANLHTILKPFLLRRLKSDVEKELPKKKEYLLYASLTPKQHELYQAVLEKKLRAHLHRSAEDGLHVHHHAAPGQKRRRVEPGQFKEASSDDSFTVTESSAGEEAAAELVAPEEIKTGSTHFQNTLMQLRKVCNHPYLFEFPADKDGNVVVDEGLVQASGKMRLLDQLLGALIRAGHKVLIFSQMSRMLNLLEDYLAWRNIQYCRIDGSVPQAERSAQIDAFNKDRKIQVFLLTTRAGGLGINLVSADTVIFYDSDWNPQMDLQAQDRVHRIGQTKPVLVYRLAVASSVECRILERASSKRRLEKMVIHRKKFKGKQQYFKDDRILLADLEDILRDKDAVPVNEGKEILSKEDLAVLMDRSDQTLASKEGKHQTFKVLQEIRSEAMDSLASQ